MDGANIFIIYADSKGSNVTLSPRPGEGHNQPKFTQGTQAFLLEGSGIANGKMTANVRCSYTFRFSDSLYGQVSEPSRFELRQMARQHIGRYIHAEQLDLGRQRRLPCQLGQPGSQSRDAR